MDSQRQALGEFKRTSDQKKKSEDSQESENRSPAKNDFQPASEDGRHYGCKPEDDRRVGHDRLGIWSGKAVADHRPADHHAHAGGQLLPKPETPAK